MSNVIEYICENVSLSNNLSIFREKEVLIKLYEECLLLFNSHTSIVSKSYPFVNDLKVSMTETITQLFLHHTCPINIYRIYFCTILNESSQVINDLVIEKILVNCMKLVNDHIIRKIYPEFISDDVRDLVFALFIYSVTNQEEHELI